MLILAGGAWLVFKKDDKPIAKEPNKTPAEPVSTPPEAIPTPPPPTDDASEAKSTVNVPGDASSITEALKLCKPGGTIEIAGGTYSDAIVLTQSVSLISKTSAVFEDSGLGSSLITARGPIQVTLRNIQIKNTQRQANTEIESSPALVLIADGADVRFDGCVVEGSIGSGISLVDKASATFSNCRIRKNRGYGINVSSGSNVALSLSEIQQCGRSGIAVTNVGSTVNLGSGATITANSRNGVEVANGAVLKGSGAEINGNQKIGLIVEGSGSQATLEASCVISGNHKFGAGVTNSGRLKLSDSTVEENSENGVYRRERRPGGNHLLPFQIQRNHRRLSRRRRSEFRHPIQNILRVPFGRRRGLRRGRRQDIRFHLHQQSDGHLLRRGLHRIRHRKHHPPRPPRRHPHPRGRGRGQPRKQHDSRRAINPRCCKDGEFRYWAESISKTR